ncbi:MAG TPA: hypothetical protein VFR41_12140 [Acidimicrobiia bacterium]|nr:hypothetical protein [Acidimicrobiia bacterium]
MASPSDNLLPGRPESTGDNLIPGAHSHLKQGVAAGPAATVGVAVARWLHRHHWRASH